MTVDNFIKRLKAAVEAETVKTGKPVGQAEIRIEGFTDFYFDYEDSSETYINTLVLTGKI